MQARISNVTSILDITRLGARDCKGQHVPYGRGLGGAQPRPQTSQLEGKMKEGTLGYPTVVLVSRYLLPLSRYRALKTTTTNVDIEKTCPFLNIYASRVL